MTRTHRNRILLAALAAALAAAAVFWPQGPGSRIGATIGAIVQPRTELGWPVYVTTIAGGPEAGFADQTGVAIDRAGNLLLADAGDTNRIG